MSEANIDPSCWTKVASGEIAGNIDWEPGFEALGNVAWFLSQFEELGDSVDIDWTMVIGDHCYFAPIRSADFPPLYNVRDFERLFWDFLAIIEEPDGSEMPGQSFDWIDLYVDTDKKDRILKTFKEFEQHLKSLRPLRDAGIIQ